METREGVKMTKVDIYTMCLVQNGDHVLLINRPSERGFPGYIGPGGKVDFPESPAEAAIREVFEETGLKVQKLIYKGLDEYVDPSKDYRYMVFNYIATSFQGELLQNPPEGELHWVPIEEAKHLPMQDWFKKRFPLFFNEGTFEVHVEWSEEKQAPVKELIQQL